MDDRKQLVLRTWMGIIGALVIIGGLGIYLYRRGQHATPTPLPSRAPIDAGLEQCSARISTPGATAVVRRRPQRDGLVTDDLPDRTQLTVRSIRMDWVEIEVPATGFVDRRSVVFNCPPPAP